MSLKLRQFGTSPRFNDVILFFKHAQFFRRYGTCKHMNRIWVTIERTCKRTVKKKSELGIETCSVNEAKYTGMHLIFSQLFTFTKTYLCCLAKFDYIFVCIWLFRLAPEAQNILCVSAFCSLSVLELLHRKLTDLVLFPQLTALLISHFNINHVLFFTFSFIHDSWLC